MFRNLTLQQVTGFLALFFTILNVVVLLILSACGKLETIGFWWWVLIVSTFLFIAYLFIQFLIEKFVFRRIRLIYKLINTTQKGVPQIQSNDVLKQSLDKVNDDVIQWAKDKQKEIDSLTELENYRRNYLGNISHELKTPIFSIQGYLLTLIEGGLYDEKVNLKYLKRALVNLDRLETIVEDLETINNLEAGKVELRLEPFDLKELTLEVIEDMGIKANEKSICLSIKEDARKSYFVNGDVERIRQVLNNLVTNSIKYGNEGGSTKIGFYDMIQNVLIEVSDDGNGIEETHLKHIFDRFYRADKSRGREIGGSGLGLAIVKHIVEAHKGSVGVRSDLGKGSTFTVTLEKKL
ncbi:MAG: two-component system phosphate regulon sensor histidine kinase PhoR [Saprospiraceae bacterium]